MQSQFHGDPLARRKFLTLAAGGAGLVSMGAPATGAPRSEISSDQTPQPAPTSPRMSPRPTYSSTRLSLGARPTLSASLATASIRLSRRYESGAKKSNMWAFATKRRRPLWPLGSLSTPDVSAFASEPQGPAPCICSMAFTTLTWTALPWSL